MELAIKTAPAAEPVLKAAAKVHLNIEAAYTSDDDYIDALILVARRNAEQITQRKLITQTWYAYMNEWPSGDAIYLPFGSLGSVTSVKYYETDDTENTMSNTEYGVDTDSNVGRIVLDYGESWPTETLRPLNPIKIEFVCGYGAAGANVPDPILHAIKVMVADGYESRQSGLTGTISAEVKTSLAVMNLLRYYKIEMRPEWL